MMKNCDMSKGGMKKGYAKGGEVKKATEGKKIGQHKKLAMGMPIKGKKK